MKELRDDEKIHKNGGRQSDTVHSGDRHISFGYRFTSDPTLETYTLCAYYSGSGLGLSIAKSLAELQNGALNIAVDGDLFKVALVFPAAQQ